MTHLFWSEIEPTPTPLPAYEGDPNLITPGVIGFVITFLVAAITVLLIVDMVRRIRRVRYREQVRAELEAEQAASAQGDSPSRAAED